MDNQKILSDIMNHIESEINNRQLSQMDVVNLCKKIGKPVSQGTISNIFKRPSSAKVSTLLNICEALGLSLFAIFRDVNNSLSSTGNDNLIYNIKHPAFQGYLNPMYIYFIETGTTRSKRLLKGKLTVGDFYHTNECVARLQIDTMEKDENGNSKYKDYEGNVVSNQNEAIFFHLISNKLGDEWSLIFNHGNLNQNTLACSLGTAVTLSSGKSTRYPTMHFVCLSHQELSEEKEEIIANRLLIHNQDIVISESSLQTFLANEELDSHFRENLISCTNRKEAKAYVIPISSLSPFVSDPKILYDMTIKLLKYSSCETAYRILPDADNKLFTALK